MRFGFADRHPVLGALAALALLALATVPSPGATAVTASQSGRADVSGAVDYLTIKATGTYGYQPDTIANLPLNTTINVTFIDDNSLPHSFNISSREGVQIVGYAGMSAAEMTQILFSAHALYAAYVTGPGNESVGAFRSPATPGWYEFVCNVSGHFQMGMFGYIAFGEGLPSNLTLPGGAGSGGIPVLPVAEVAFALAVVLAVLVIILMRLRRIARDRAMEASDKETPILSGRPPPP